MAAVVVPEDGWISTIVARPEDFTELLARTNHEGWVAYHRGEYALAAEAFGPGLAGARAWEAEVALHQDLALLAGTTWERTFTTWGERSVIPEDSAIPLVAALSAWDQGDAERARAWLSRPMSNPEHVAAARALASGLVELPGDGPLATRLREHLRYRNTDTIGRLTAPFDALLLSEPAESGSRALYDPLVFGTLARAARTASRTSLAGQTLADALRSAEPPLAALLFSPWWSAADLEADLAHDGAPFGAHAPSWLPDTRAPDAPDDADAARARVSALDAALDAWSAGLLEKASPEGQELLIGLSLVAVYRSQLLLGWARAALAADRPKEALVLAQLAQDLRSPRQIGPTNPPALYAVMAHAELRLGHTRQALDALTPLVAALPLAKGLSETLGDLAVLEGMGRLGDSKEN